MLEKLASIKKQLSELATVLNAFKSESVQLRILDMLLAKQSTAETNDQPGDDRTSRLTRVERAPIPKKAGGAAPAKRKKAPAGAGACATLTQLLSGSFFDKPRNITEIIDHCRHNLARTFKANELSGKLARMVRTVELSRKKNANNQYEYKKP